MEPAYKSGYESYLRNKDRYQNPYEHGTNEYNLFERGWTQALKRSPEKNSKTSTTTGGILPQSSSHKKTATQLSAEAYARRKD